MSRPNAARVYDYLIGGKASYAADRALAEELLRVHPGLRALALENRAFICGDERRDGAVLWVARMLGARQYIDAGCGLPVTPMVHEIAREGHLASVAYVDSDPVAVSLMRAALDGAGPGLAVAEADVSDPAAVLADEGLRGVIDLSQPACVVFGGTLSAMPAEVAQKAVAGFSEAMAPGSAVVISCVSYGDLGLGERMAAAYGTAGQWRNHGAGDIEGFFAAGGLRIVHGKVMDARCWPACPAAPPARDAQVLGGIGVKP